MTTPVDKPESLTLEQIKELLGGPKELTEEEWAALPPDKQEQEQTFRQMLRDLRWIVSKDGSNFDVSYVAATVAYHLTRCGYRMDSDKRIIKARQVVGRGVPTGAVEWVPMDAPDDPLDGIENMTLRELAALTPAQRHEAILRLGGEVPNDLPTPPNGWEMKPRIAISDEPDTPFKK